MINYSISKTQRMAAVFLAVAFALLMLCSLGAKADEYQSINIGVGSSRSLNIQNKDKSNYATLLSSSSANNSVVTVSNDTSRFTLTGISAGTAQVTIRVHDNSDGSEYNWILTVTVTGSSTDTRNVSTPLGTTLTLDNFSYVASTNSSDTSVSTVYQSGTAVMATALRAGTSTITVTGTKTGSAYQATYVYYLTVTSSSTGTGNSSNLSLRVGQDALIGQGGAYSSVRNYSSSNSYVATVSLSNNNVISIAGKASGTAVITYTATIADTGQVVTYTINVTVTGSLISDGYVENVYNDNTSGLNIGIAERLVAEGKSYRLKGITLNGTPIAANELLWLSSDDSIVTVNKNTGIFNAKKTGTTRLIAVDKMGRYHLTVAITVQ